MISTYDYEMSEMMIVRLSLIEYEVGGSAK